MSAFVTSDGARLHYTDRGEGAVVLLLHGCWMSGRFFDRLLDALSLTCRVIAVDFRGHGSSAKVLQGHTVDRYAADVEELLARLDVEHVTVVGWSMGAFVAWEYLLTRPRSRISRMVVVDQPATDFRSEDWPLGFADLEVLTALMHEVQTDFPSLARELVPKMFFQPPEDRELEWMCAEVERVPAAIAGSILFDQTVRDYRQHLGHLAVPTLVCFGVDEKIMPVALGRVLAEQLPHARLEVFDYSGHCPFYEETERFTSIVRGFVESTDPVSVTSPLPPRYFDLHVSA